MLLQYMAIAPCICRYSDSELTLTLLGLSYYLQKANALCKYEDTQLVRFFYTSYLQVTTGLTGLEEVR